MSTGLTAAVTAADFEAIILNNPIVFLDFWASWCAPCRQFGKVYEKIAAEYQGQIYFGKINVEVETELAESFAIRSIPHVMVFKQGIAIYSEAGSLPESALKELIEQALAVDMSQLEGQ